MLGVVYALIMSQEDRIFKGHGAGNSSLWTEEPNGIPLLASTHSSMTWGGHCLISCEIHLGIHRERWREWGRVVP